MSKFEILHYIALAVQKYILHGCSAGITKESASIKITDNEGKKFLITVKEIQ